MSQTGANRELQRQIANSFRNFDLDGYSRTPLPWIYGDAMQREVEADRPSELRLVGYATLVSAAMGARGHFVPDYDPGVTPPGSLDQVPLGRAGPQCSTAPRWNSVSPRRSTRGCEITWPIRHTTMFMAPFRIRHGNSPPVDYGDVLTPQVALGPGGPLYGQPCGGLSRWMAVPWQADTASCRSGYDTDYDPYLPTFWPARVPNEILYVQNYLVAVDPSKSPEVRARRVQYASPLV